METQQIFMAFDGKLIGRKRMIELVCEVLSGMPESITNYISSRCWFISSMDDAWAFTFVGNDMANQHMIFISDELLTQPEKQVRYTIAHEIGHVMLRHKNSTHKRQSDDEISAQEMAAHDFASQFEPLD